LSETYTYEESGETRTETAPDGSQFAIATAEATNRAADIRDVPGGFLLYGPENRYNISGDYVPADEEFTDRGLLGGATRTGDLLFEVSSDLTQDDISLIRGGTTSEGDIAVSWQK
jgi:hypothetical protein